MAGRIPQEFIDELLARVDVVRVIEPYIALKKNGANYVALCPFHQEKTPSFSVSPRKQLYYCFGCGAGGNAIGFLMDYVQLSFLEAVEKLAAQVNMPIPRDVSFAPQENKNASLYEVMEKAASFYHRQLLSGKSSESALSYLKERGISEKTLKHFSLGYAPKGWRTLFSAVRGDVAQQQSLLATGMFVQKESSEIYDRFRDRILFPIRDRKGRVVAFGGRVLGDELPKYLNSPETPIFHKGQELYGLYEALQQNRQLDRLLVVEGYMDVIGLVQHGITYAVATLGTATSKYHIQKMFRLCKEVVFCFDGDSAGEKAAWRALEVLLPIVRDDWKVTFVFLPAKEDPDSLIQKEGKEAFERRIDSAQSWSDFFFERLMEQSPREGIGGLARAANVAKQYLQAMPDNIMRDMLLKKLAKNIGMDVGKLQAHIFDTSPAAMPQKSDSQGVSDAIEEPSVLVRKAIAFLLQYPHLADKMEEALPSEGLAGLSLLHAVMESVREHSAAHAGVLLEEWRVMPEGSYLLSLMHSDLMIPESGVLEEWQAIVSRIKLQAEEQQIDKLMLKAAQIGLTQEERLRLKKCLEEKNRSER